MKSHDPADFKLKVDPRDGALTGNYGYTHLDVCFVVHERAHPIDRHGCPVKFVVGFHWPASNGKRSTIDRAKPRSGQSREPRLASPNGMLTLRWPEAGEGRRAAFGRDVQRSDEPMPRTDGPLAEGGERCGHSHRPHARPRWRWERSPVEAR